MILRFFSKMAAVRHLGVVMCFIRTTLEANLVVFIAVLNLVGIDAIVLIISNTCFSISRAWLENACSRPSNDNMLVLRQFGLLSTVF